MIHNLHALGITGGHHRLAAMVALGLIAEREVAMLVVADAPPEELMTPEAPKLETYTLTACSTGWDVPAIAPEVQNPRLKGYQRHERRPFYMHVPKTRRKRK